MNMVSAKDIAAKLAIGDVEIAEFPNAGTILHEHAKTVIALATTFLGLAVTFADKILGSTPELWQIYVLRGVWLALLLSVLMAIIIVVQLNAFATGKSKDFQRTWSVAAWSSTLSYLILLVAAAGVGVVGLGGRSQAKPVDAAGALTAGLTFVSSIHGNETGTWNADQMQFRQATDRFDILFTAPNIKKQVCLSIDRREGKVLSYAPCAGLLP